MYLDTLYSERSKRYMIDKSLGDDFCMLTNV